MSRTAARITQADVFGGDHGDTERQTPTHKVFMITFVVGHRRNDLRGQRLR
jgi:hypothetical protein